ncbi:hypothetical protein CC030809_00109 [Synechococcus phage S-CAM7]|uniref:Uncharacterized protein n=1 Tax=Synechococcus phage S-CAM7 TaxID=1883368 RepID=A0A7D5JNC8_9CAUD|nr:hypothetical protein CC030809_00109 [Synechococcus phage S-CAM7]
MATYTNAQLIAFFKQWEPKVQYFGIDIVPPGFFKFYKQGRELVKAEAAATLAAAKTNSRTPLTESELRPVFEEYLATYLDNGLKAKVFDRYAPVEAISTERLDRVATVMGIHGQIAARDTRNNSTKSCLDRMGKTLVAILEEYNEMVGFERFAA